MLEIILKKYFDYMLLFFFCRQYRGRPMWPSRSTMWPGTSEGRSWELRGGSGAVPFGWPVSQGPGRQPFPSPWKSTWSARESLLTVWMGTTSVQGWTRTWASLPRTARRTSDVFLKFPSCLLMGVLSASLLSSVHSKRYIKEYSSYRISLNWNTQFLFTVKTITQSIA